MIDTHIHLDDKKFVNRDEIIKNFQTDNIEFAINNSCDLKTMYIGYNLAKQYNNIYCTIGCHPHEANSFNQEMIDEMTKLSTCEKVVAVGEIGLDYYYDFADRDLQKSVFLQQLVLADKFDLPIVLHLRDAYADMLDILKSNKKLLRNSGIVHCFSGSKEIAAEFLKLGLCFSFGGAITFKNAKKDDIIKSIPMECILSETDGPYLAPEPVRGTVNEPKNVIFPIRKMAEIYGVTFLEMENIIRANALRIFKKLPRGNHE